MSYCKLMKVKKMVLAHVKQCYEIRHEKARQMRKYQKVYHSLLNKEKECDFPPMPPINSFEDLDSNDEDIFSSEDKDEMHQVDDLYAVETKADA